MTTPNHAPDDSRAQARDDAVDPATDDRPPARTELPAHAQTVLVPLANPDTAPELLQLAQAVCKAEGGKIIGLAVVLGEEDAESRLDRLDALSQIVDTFRARDGVRQIEVVTRPAPSVARGILDAIRDEGADLVVLGVQAAPPGASAIAGVTQQVIRAADCDVLVFRRGRRGQGLADVNGVVVGVDDGDAARVAARFGVLIGEGLHAPVTMLHVRTPGISEDLAALTLDEAVTSVEGEERCQRKVVTADTSLAGLRRSIPHTSLAVVGLTSVSEVGQTRLGSTTQAALDALSGPVLAISRPVRLGAADRVIRLMRPKLTAAEEQSLVWHARLNATASTDFVVLCVVAAMLATFGLLLNSAAVIIGAMLVAPLMSPIVAFGTALVDGEVRVLRRAGITLGIGSALVAVTSILIGLLSGVDVPTDEMLSRGSPSLIDAGVAAASGLIGGYAQARRGIPAALAGVAISAALVPPICVFGLALSMDLRLAAGSGLLFITNIACIAVVSGATLLWLGVHLNRSGAARTRYLRVTGPVIAAVLLAVVLFGLSSTGPDLPAVQQIVEEELGDVEVVGIDLLGPVDTVTVTVRTAQAPAPAAVAVASQRVQEVSNGLVLRVAVQQLVAPQ